MQLIYPISTHAQVEMLSLSRDTTEADLKQRREILNGSVCYHDSAPVRAALHGRILLLDGVEKAERNVLPTINNLLENREMALPDGRFLIAPARYDELVAARGLESLEAENLVRVHEDFLVIAIGLPVPTFPGYPLDPPLRSRFQGRFVDSLTPAEQLQRLRLLLPGDTPASVAKALTVFGDTFRRLSGRM